MPPTYEYVCQKCQHQWEELQNITDKSTERCPKCKKLAAKRQIGTPMFVLKGDGWASDGYSKP